MHTTGASYPYTSMPPYRFFPKFGTQIDKSCQDIHHIHDTKHNKSDYTPKSILKLLKNPIISNISPVMECLGHRIKLVKD
ncbi:MAG: hypothetical protein OXC46_04750 [Thaumarchaeota archaeon]|nr:hypothetical protein [Nitrososphaerota archaeon]